MWKLVPEIEGSDVKNINPVNALSVYKQNGYGLKYVVNSKSDDYLIVKSMAAFTNLSTDFVSCIPV
jgi:hypothetical protein